VGPLTGLKVLEIAGLAPGPFGCVLLADLGADVLVVQRRERTPGINPPAGPLDRGKRSVKIDLKSEAGEKALHDLAAKADVFVEGFRPGVAERLGFGPETLMALNPRLIYGRITGWGQTGPLSQTAGHDINYVAAAGALDLIGIKGEAPHPAANLLGDFAGGGSFLAIGVLAALYERERSGRGQVIDASIIDGAAMLTSFLHGMKAAGMWTGRRGENLLDGGRAFYGTYETSDGKYMAVGALEPAFFGELVANLGLDPASVPPQFDEDGQAEMRTIFSTAFLKKSRTEWTSVFSATDSCVTPVLSPWEAAEFPNNQDRHAYIEVDGLTQPAPAPRFSRSETRIPTGMDAGGRDVKGTLRSWGLDAKSIEHMVASNAVD
jgi:alpha-methylacyl-CoA racemase